jgi:hypothetical protein
MAFPTSAGGLFGQGAFQIDPNATPEQLARKREMLAAMMPTYGKARYVGEGLGQLATGIASGRKNKALDKFEGEKAKEASSLFDRVMSGGGPLSILGMAPDAPMGTPFNAPSQPAPPSLDAMFPVGQEGPTPQQDVVSYGGNNYAMGEYVPQGARIPDEIRNGIFAGESGGDYNALFGFSNRDGKRYSGVRLTDMTVDQALKFASPQGDYGQWVKGQVGRVATPMGAYQIVGTTLRGAKKALGLTGSERMTPELQDALGAYIYQTQGIGAWEGYRGPQSSFAPGPGAQVAQNGPAMSDLMQAAQNPWLSPQQRALITGEIQRQQGVQQSQQERMGRREDFTWEQQQRQQDPAYLMDLERQRIELERMQNPQPGFAVLSPQEIQQLGLPPGAYQRGPDGKVLQVGGGGTSVTVNNAGDPNAARMGTIPQGYTAIEDPNSPAGYRMVAIPGGPEDTAAASAVKAGNASTATSILTTAARRAREAAGNREFGGVGSGLIGMINPYSDSAEVIRQVEVLKSNAKIENLTAMRAASPTGGALGAVSDKESEMLAAKSGALDPRSPNFLRDLDDYERTLLRVVHGPEEGDRIFAETRGGDAAPAPATSSDTVPPPPPGANPATWPTASEWKYMTPEEKALFQ